MSETTLESRVVDLEEAVSVLLEAATYSEPASPGEALEQMHQRFRQRLREKR